jgi:hypothetical protein
MADMSFEFTHLIERIERVPGSAKMIFVFKDESQLMFEVVLNTTTIVMGTKGCQADRFESSVKSFTPITGGYEFTFSDGTQLRKDLDGPAGIVYQ